MNRTASNAQLSSASSRPLLKGTVRVQPNARRLVHQPATVTTGDATTKPWKAEPPFIGGPHKRIDFENFSQNLRDPKDASAVDVLVCGSGPAGLAVAGRVAASGLRVALVDPDPLLNFVPTYGVWIDEFKAMGFADCFEWTWEKAVVYLDSGADGKPVAKNLSRPYARIDREKFKTKLVRMCTDNGVQFIKAKVANVNHQEGLSTVKLDNGTLIPASIVVDCTGFNRRLVQFDKPFNPGYQGAYGILCEVESHPFDQDKMLFMDWRDDHTHDEPAMRDRNSQLPTFLYAMPMGPTRIFFEETSLVARPAVPFDELKERMYKRLHHYGVKVKGVIEEEFCLIPMGSVLPAMPQRVIGVGGTGGHVHPSTGYMVARTIGVAPEVADAIVEQLHRPSDKATEAGTPRHPSSEQEAELIARNVWRSAWPAERLYQREFFNFGMDVLLQLNLSQTRQFFNAFFDLSAYHWQGFLSSRLAFGELIAFGLSLFAKSSNEARAMLLSKGAPGLFVMLKDLAFMKTL